MAMGASSTEAANEQLVREAMVQVRGTSGVCSPVVGLDSAARPAAATPPLEAAHPRRWAAALQIQHSAGLGCGCIPGLSPAFTLRSNSILYDCQSFLAMWRDRRVGAHACWGAD